MPLTDITKLHKSLLPENQHIIYAFEYVDDYEMRHDTLITIHDIGKVAKRNSDSTYWILTKVFPVTWKKISDNFNSINAQWSGPIVPAEEGQRWYPADNIVLYDIFASIGTPSSYPVVVNLLRNGSQVTSVTINAGQQTSNRLVVPNQNLSINDYLTTSLSVSAGADGANVSMSIRYFFV